MVRTRVRGRLYHGAHLLMAKLGNRKYGLSAEEVHTFVLYMTAHLKNCPEKKNAHGILLTVNVCETGIGAETHLKCRCGWDFNITDYSIW